MPRQITMPQQSDTMTEGTLVAWNVKEGDKYAEGDVVAEIETDKATMEMEGPDEPGVIAAILIKEGEAVPVGTVIALVALDGEDAAEVKKSAGGASAKKQEGGENLASSGQAPATTAAPESTPAAGREAYANGESKNGHKSNGQTRTNADADYGGPATVTMDMPAADSNGHGGGRVKASPIARRIAENKGIDLSQLQGSGPGGRIVQQDVLNFKPQSAPKPNASGSGSAPKSAPALLTRVASGQTETVELSKMRATIAKRLQQSKQNLPHFYETVDIELDAAESLRGRLNKQMEKEGVRLSIGDVIAKAVAVALKTHPVLNSTFDGTTITRHGDVHLGMAVALDDGLIVPVLRNIDQMGFREIRLRSKELVDKARAQKLKGDEMSGATFTVSNLGGFGVREFVAIINPPEVGILAIGAGTKRAVVADDGSIVARTVMSVTLSADHRVVDGADSARFLATLKSMLEEPGMMLI